MGFKPSSKIFSLTIKAVLLWIICVSVSCVSHAFGSVHCCPVVICWERAGLLAFVGDVYCILLLSAAVSWVRCGTLWYRFLIFASFITFNTCLTFKFLLQVSGNIK